MKRFALTFMVLASISAGSAKADMLDFIGANRNVNGITEFKDEDFEELLGGDSTIDVGDLIVGIFEFEELGPAAGTVNPAPDGSSLVGFSLLKVAAKIPGADIFPPPGPDTFTFVFAPATGAEWAATVGFVPVHPGTLFALFNEQTPSSFGEGGSVAAGLASIDTSDPVLEFGFAGAAGEVMLAILASDVVTSPAIFASPNDIIGNLSVTFNATGLVFNPHNHLLSPFGAAQVQIKGELLPPAVFPPASAAAWDVKTSSQFYVAAVPEPTTFVVWAALFGGAAGIRRIRRRKDQIAA